MKTREEIFNEVTNRYYKNSEFYILVHIVSNIEFALWLYPFDAIMKGCVWNCLTNEETGKRKVARIGDFEDDLYYLIDSLIEDAKEAEML